jgi:OOP family OmpA-OmpF porin
MNHTRVLAVASLVAVLATAVMTSSARAAEPGFYLGASYLQTTQDLNKQFYDSFIFNNVINTDFTPTSFTSTLDDSFNGYGFYGGYRFNRHFALEGGYVNLGSFKYRGKAMGLISNTIPSNAIYNYDGRMSGMSASAIGVWPLSYRWEVYGRGGAMFTTSSNTRYYADASGPQRRPTGSESDVDLLAGVGTSFNFFEIYDLHLEYLRVFDAGDEVIGEGDASTITLGISVVF